jgi:hypothetical protein
MTSGASPADQPPQGPRRRLPGPGPGVPPGPGPLVPPGSIAPPDNPSLTGSWLANDGTYYLRQIGDELWWVGVSAGIMYPGVESCTVFHGSVTGSGVTGEWSAVPRGALHGHGTLTLRRDGDNQLLRVGETGGFGPSSWRRPSTSTWPVAIIDQEFPTTLKNVVANGHWSQKTTLEDNLRPLVNSVSVFANIARDIEDADAPPVTVGFPSAISNSPQEVFSYSDFICLNDGSLAFGLEDQDDGDTTFWFQTDTGQIARQPAFFDPASSNELRIEIEQKLKARIEGEILMFGRSADCGDDGADTAGPSFPGWAERTQGSSVLFNGRPIRVVVPGLLGNLPSSPSFLTELSFGDPVRVTGALVYDHGHGDDNPKKLEIHPVYAVDKITATFSADLSGGWADDVGNTYYLRHDLTDNSVWYAAISPLGYSGYGQVFQGTFHPRQVVVAEASAPENIGPSPLLQDAVTGEFAAIGFGFGAPPSAALTGSRIGDTGAVTFGLGTTMLVGREVPMLSTGEFRLMKLYDE